MGSLLPQNKHYFLQSVIVLTEIVQISATNSIISSHSGKNIIKFIYIYIYTHLFFSQFLQSRYHIPLLVATWPEHNYFFFNHFSLADSFGPFEIYWRILDMCVIVIYTIMPE